MDENDKKQHYSFGWITENWRAISAFVYAIICIFDFIVYPTFIGLNRQDLLLVIESISELDVSIQQTALNMAYREFTPYTLKGSGLFHLSFGAILTGAAISRPGTNKS